MHQLRTVGGMMHTKLRRKYPHLIYGMVEPVTSLEVLNSPQALGCVPLNLQHKHCPDWVITNGSMTRLRPTSANVGALARLGGWTIQFNEMTKQTEIAYPGMVVPDDDHENTALTLFGDFLVRHGLSRDGIGELVDAVARTNAYHPVRDWVTATPWDGVDRLEMFAKTLKLKEPTKAKLAYRMLHKWMLQGIGAMYEPNGIAAGGALVLAGPQYTGKTYWVMHLVPISGACTAGLTIDPSNKDTIIKAIRCLIAEIGELDGTTRKADVAMLKAFLSDMVDEIRLPYARRAARFKRRTVFCATVNGTGFLVDETGNRRFWVIEVVGCDVLDPNTMQQVWAQYHHLYQQGQRWILEPELLVAINSHNRDYEAVDPLAERIARHYVWHTLNLSSLTPENRLQHPDIAWKTATQICIDVGLHEPRRSDATRVGAIVRNLYTATCSATPDMVALLERRSDGTRFIAVPRSKAVAWS